MAWEAHGNRKYFYRSVWHEGRVKKLYYGAGPLGQLAANADALRRAEAKAIQEARRAHADRLDIAQELTRTLSQGCALLVAATLLAAGYHRPGRHSWRRWRNGRRALKQAK
jgi:hypothetical protein